MSNRIPASSRRRFDENTAQIISVCNDFCRNEVEPVALEMDAHYDPEKIKALWKKALEPGIPALLIPEEYGGAGLDALTAALVLDELAYGCTGVATLLAHHFAACLVLIEEASTPSRKELLPRLSGGLEGEPVLATFAYPDTEDREGWPRLVETDGKLELSGSTGLVAGASLADRIVLFPKESNGSDVSCVVVNTRSKGVRVGEMEEMLGLHTVPFAPITFDKSAVAKKDIVAGKDKAEAIMQRTMMAFYGFVAAIAMGASRSGHMKAYQYAKQRYQFGKMIIEHHEMQRLLANMLSKINAGTAAYVQAFTGEALKSLATGGEGDLTKIFCTDAALEIAIDAIQVHGGIGYMKDTGVEKIMRDAKMLQLIGASNRFMEVDIVAKRYESERGAG